MVPADPRVEPQPPDEAALLVRLRAGEDAAFAELMRLHADGHRVDPGPAWRSDALDPLEQREVRVRVRAAIDQLPEIYRSALLLRDIEELSWRSPSPTSTATEMATSA